MVTKVYLSNTSEYPATACTPGTYHGLHTRDMIGGGRESSLSVSPQETA
jgi:hypothetical protein